MVDGDGARRRRTGDGCVGDDDCAAGGRRREGARRPGSSQVLSGKLEDTVSAEAAGEEAGKSEEWEEE